MEISPQRVRSAEFKSVRKGADPDEIKAFLNDVADELERAQNQSTAMEARARAAIARLQEMNDGSRPSAPAASAPDVSADEADTISRTLLLAQRTADSTVAEARAEAARIVQAANTEASTTIDSAREMSTRLIEEARAGARQAGEAERITVAGEVDALKARRDFLESDVEQLELFLTDQRSRLREAATALLDVTERVPGGLGEVRPPLLSASDDDDGRGGDEVASLGEESMAADVSDIVEEPDVSEMPDLSEASEMAEQDQVSEESEESGQSEDEQPATNAAPDDLVIVADLAGVGDGDQEQPGAAALLWGSDDGGDPTEALHVGTARDVDSAQRADEQPDEEILFSFDDDRR
jgi:cell division septum initiation protein DivIVA